jgi:hypothetical protein
MAFNYKLIGQVKQAMYKLAAPPAEVTEGKPYVRPPELAPEQPKTKEESREEFLRSMTNESARATAPDMTRQQMLDNIRHPLIDVISEIPNFRAYKNIPSNADLSSYPKVQEEYKKLYVPRIQELMTGVPENELEQLKNELGGDLGLDYFLQNAHGLPGYRPVGAPGPASYKLRDAVNASHSSAIKDYASNYLQAIKEKNDSSGWLHDNRNAATAEDLGKLKGTATVIANQLDPHNVGRIAGRLFFGTNRRPHTDIKPQTIIKPQDVSVPKLDLSGPIPKPNLAALAKPPAPKAPTPNLPAIPDTPPNIRRLGGGKNY